MVSAMAARYRQGHFLNAHNDSAKDEDSAFAYVINLGRGWQPDWGGPLQLLEGSDDIETFVPYWNSLSLFRVPQMPQYTLFSPWACADRYSIAGWVRRCATFAPCWTGSSRAPGWDEQREGNAWT